MYIIAFAVFFSLFIALYLVLRAEEKQFDQVGETLSEKEDEVADESEERNLVWEGRVEDFPIRVRRGMMFRDSNRLITVEVPFACQFHLRLDPANPLRRLTRGFNELITENSRVNRTGSLQPFLIYTDAPDEARDILSRLEANGGVKLLKEFHHVIFDRERLTAWFYQPDIESEVIRERTRQFVDLLKLINIRELVEE